VDLKITDIKKNNNMANALTPEEKTNLIGKELN
jgi:hypothetical protein